MAADKIDTAMVLAAGFGKRLRPITETIPKPLVQVGGRTMLDRTLDTLIESGIGKAVVNMHYLGDQIATHCATRKDINCVISDERDMILETGGGTVKALPLLGKNPFVLVNADTFWVDFDSSTLSKMISNFDPSEMDVLLLLCRAEDATGHSGGSDFLIDRNGALSRARRDDPNGYIYAGAAVYHPAVFKDASHQSHSLNVYFDNAINAGRLYGLVLENGHWFTVGTPDGLREVELKLSEYNQALSG